MSDENLCGLCQRPIHSSDPVRHHGYFTSHLPTRCVELLKSELSASKAENERLRHLADPLSAAAIADREDLEADRDALAERVKGREAAGCHGLDTPERVRFYEHDFYVLSNFSAFNLYYKNSSYATSEHAYQAEKFHQRDRQHIDIAMAGIETAVRHARSAHEAFKLAERHRDKRRPDWDETKVDVMREILRAKVGQHEYVRRKLLATGDRELVEDSWRDDFWGWGPNRDGQNMLGKLWMEVRAELVADTRDAIGDAK